jgi:hypothetical protein
MSAAAEPIMRRADCGTTLGDDTAFLKEDRIPGDALIVISVWTTSRTTMGGVNASAMCPQRRGFCDAKVNPTFGAVRGARARRGFDNPC